MDDGGGDSCVGAAARGFDGFLVAGAAAVFSAPCPAERAGEFAGGDEEGRFAGGSADMMLTAGVEAELGNSALVGRPVGNEGGNPEVRAATGLVVVAAGAFQEVA